jgi:hypothetical protein
VSTRGHYRLTRSGQGLTQGLNRQLINQVRVTDHADLQHRPVQHRRRDERMAVQGAGTRRLGAGNWWRQRRQSTIGAHACRRQMPEPIVDMK